MLLHTRANVIEIVWMIYPREGNSYGLQPLLIIQCSNDFLLITLHLSTNLRTQPKTCVPQYISVTRSCMGLISRGPTLQIWRSTVQLYLAHFPTTVHVKYLQCVAKADAHSIYLNHTWSLADQLNLPQAQGDVILTQVWPAAIPNKTKERNPCIIMQ